MPLNDEGKTNHKLNTKPIIRFYDIPFEAVLKSLKENACSRFDKACTELVEVLSTSSVETRASNFSE